MRCGFICDDIYLLYGSLSFYERTELLIFHTPPYWMQAKGMILHYIIWWNSMRALPSSLLPIRIRIRIITKATSVFIWHLRAIKSQCMLNDCVVRFLIAWPEVLRVYLFIWLFSEVSEWVSEWGIDLNGWMRLQHGSSSSNAKHKPKILMTHQEGINFIVGKMSPLNVYWR